MPYKSSSLWQMSIASKLPTKCVGVLRPPPIHSLLFFRFILIGDVIMLAIVVASSTWPLTKFVPFPTFSFSSINYHSLWTPLSPITIRRHSYQFYETSFTSLIDCLQRYHTTYTINLGIIHPVLIPLLMTWLRWGFIAVIIITIILAIITAVTAVDATALTSTIIVIIVITSQCISYNRHSYYWHQHYNAWMWFLSLLPRTDVFFIFFLDIHSLTFAASFLSFLAEIAKKWSFSANT